MESRESALVHLRYAISGLVPHGCVDKTLEEFMDTLENDPLSLLARWWDP